MYGLKPVPFAARNSAADGSNTDGEGLGAGFVGVGPRIFPALETALEQAHEAGVPVAEDEQDQKRRGEEVVIGEGIGDSEREVTADG